MYEHELIQAAHKYKGLVHVYAQVSAPMLIAPRIKVYMETLAAFADCSILDIE